jgi:hypothetical protein
MNLPPKPGARPPFDSQRDLLKCFCKVDIFTAISVRGKQQRRCVDELDLNKWIKLSKWGGYLQSLVANSASLNGAYLRASYVTSARKQ